MPFITINITGITELMGGLNDIMRNSPQTTRNIIDEAMGLFERTAKSKVHVITGKTKNSIRGQVVTNKQGIFEARWGAKYEEKRPGTKGAQGPHNFFTQSINVLNAQLPSIIRRHYDELIKRSRRV